MSRRQFMAGAAAGTAGLLWAEVGRDVGWAGVTPAAASSARGAFPGRPEPPRALTVAGLDQPIGLGPADLQFAWQVNDLRRGSIQSAYQILVSQASLPGGTGGHLTRVWDSGRVTSPDQAFVPYRGPVLAPDSVYHWTVRTADATGAMGPWAPRQPFETGLDERGWRAHWITRAGAPANRPDIYTYYRREATLGSSPIVRGRVYVSGDQQYELYVNGVRAGKGQAYCYPDSQYFETLDVTGLLRAGASNAFAAVTSWQGATKGHPAGRPGLIVQVSVTHAGGHREVITSDGSWRVLEGAWLPGSQRDLEGDLVDFTENIDGPAVPLGWLLPGFDDSGWATAAVVGRAGTRPWTRLLSVRNRIVDQPLAPVSVKTLASGAVVADFGRIFAASPSVTFHQGQTGRTITMHAGYLLDDGETARASGGVAGQVSTEHGTQHTDMSYSYVQRGGTEEFRAFDYLGWRYLQIDSPGEPIAVTDVAAYVRHTALPPVAAAAFSSSEPVVDSIFDLARHSALYTAQEQYIDTPTREKGPWLWDGFNESVTAMSAFGEQNLTRKSLLEFAQSQGRYWPNGAVNKIYPTGLGALDINEYTEIYPEWVWQYWGQTGDLALLGEVYPALVRLADYVDHSVDRTTGLVTRLPATNIYYAFPVVTRLNVLGMNVFRRVGDMAAALGRPAREVRRQRARQQALTSAINRRLSRADGIYVDGLDGSGAAVTTASQDTNAAALVYGVVPAGRRQAVAAYVAALEMQAPPRTAAEVMEALGLAGLDEAMVGILTNAGIDGWARLLAQGGTFTWEVWEPSDANGDSMSHGWGANVLVAIQRWLLGVRTSGAAWASFDVSPPATALAWAKGTIPTPRGTLAVSWRRPTTTDRAFLVDLTVPSNASARLHLPVADADITENGTPLSAVRGVHVEPAQNGRAVLAVGSGTYNFRTRPT